MNMRCLSGYEMLFAFCHILCLSIIICPSSSWLFMPTVQAHFITKSCCFFLSTLSELDYEEVKTWTERAVCEKKIFCNCTKMEVFFKKNKKIKPSFWINVPGQSTRGHLRGLYNAIHLFEVHFTPLNASFGIEAHHHSGSCTFFSRAQVIYSV